MRSGRKIQQIYYFRVCTFYITLIFILLLSPSSSMYPTLTHYAHSLRHQDNRGGKGLLFNCYHFTILFSVQDCILFLDVHVLDINIKTLHISWYFLVFYHSILRYAGRQRVKERSGGRTKVMSKSYVSIGLTSYLLIIFSQINLSPSQRL